MQLQTRIELPGSKGPVRPPVGSHDVLALLEILWARRRPIGIVAGAIAALGLLILALVPNVYSSTASIQLTFNKDPLNSKNETRSVASIDAGALVNGAALNIASLPVAGEVVSRLKIEQEPAYNRPKRWSAFFSKFGIQRRPPTAHELAVEDALRDLKVEYKANLYVIGITYKANSPEKAATMANAFGLEYLRSERLKELSEANAVVAREIVNLAETMGERHPRMIDARSRRKYIEEQIAETKQSEVTPERLLLADQQFVPAVMISTPTGPKRLLFTAAILIGALAAAIALALWLDKVQLNYKW